MNLYFLHMCKNKKTNIISGNDDNSIHDYKFNNNGVFDVSSLIIKSLGLEFLVLSLGRLLSFLGLLLWERISP